MAENHIVKEKIVDTLEKNYMPYAMSVIVSRAIPEIDGFKPSHRKLLYTMYKMGLQQGSTKKCATVVGETMKLNPHGDGAIYETLVRLTRGHEALLVPYIESKGSFGKHYSRDMAYAAPRYTECKLAKISDEIFKDLDKNTVDMVDNYDGTLKEPVLLPTTFPNILVAANEGIAVGMASKICSFNLKEICDATIAYIDDKDCDLSEYITAPDFSTGGEIVYKKEEMQHILETGRGSFSIRGKYQFDKKNSCIDIYEIPYSTTSEDIIDAVINLVKTGKIKEINDIRDETDLKGLKITIDIKKSADPEELMNKLYKLTPLQNSFGCNFNLLIDGQPKVLGVKAILREWLRFRTECISRQLRYEIEKMEARLHLLKGLNKILLDIDKAIKIIRETESDALVIPNLMWGFGIDEIQAEFVAEIKLRNLNKDYILNKLSEIEGLEKDIADKKDLLGSDRRIRTYIKKQLTEIAKKYGAPRKTTLIGAEDVVVITADKMIEDYNLKLFLTNDGYFKKIPLTALRSSPEHKLKPEDFICQEQEWHNKSEILFFTNQQNCYKMKIHDIPDCKASAMGEYLNNLLQMDPEERVIRFVVTDDYKGYVLFAYENGKISKITLESYATKTNRKKLANAYYAGSKLVDLTYMSEDAELVAYSNINKVLVFSTEQIAEKSTRTSQGVQVLKQKKNSYLVKIVPLEQSGITNVKYYRTKNIPAIGAYLKEEDSGVTQLTFDSMGE